MNVGAEFALSKSKVSVGFSHLRVLSVAVEDKVNPGMTLQLAAELDHANDNYRVGFGLQIGS